MRCDHDAIAFGLNTNAIYVLLNAAGDGNLRVSATLDGNTWTDLAVGDLDDDGVDDLVALSTPPQMGPPNTTVPPIARRLHANGDGTFKETAHTHLPPSSTLVSADRSMVEGRSRDAVVMSAAVNSVAVMPQGAFEALTWSLAKRAAAWSADDFNGDHAPDLFALWGSTQGSIVLNDPNSRASEPNYREVAVAVPGEVLADHAVLDVNADGRPDLALLSFNSNQLYLLHGHGDGSFETAVNANTVTPPIAAAYSDLNGDGKVDALVLERGTEGTPGLSVAFGDSAGGFADAVALAASPNAVAGSLVLADVVGDSHLDALGVDANNANRLLAFAGVGDGNFMTPVQVGNTTVFGTITQVLAADFSGDGKDDLVVLGTVPAIGVPMPQLAPAGAMLLVRGEDGASSSATGLVGSFWASSLGAATVADVDQDSHKDLLVSDSSVVLKLFRGHDNGTLNSPIYYASPVSAPQLRPLVADFNGDGHNDIAATSSKVEGFGVAFQQPDCFFPAVAGLERGGCALAALEGVGCAAVPLDLWGALWAAAYGLAKVRSRARNLGA